MDNNVLIILGMHRSGTSLIAQWLNKCGLQIGDELHGPDIGNRDGHFEDVDFLSLHKQILDANKLRDDGLIHEPVKKINTYHKEKLKSIIDLKSKLYKQWGWKEPRTCLFLPLYREVLPGAKHLIILRDFHAVVNSLITRQFAVYEKQKFETATYTRKLYWSRIQRARQLGSFQRKYTGYFLKVWIWYNQQLLKHINFLDKEDFVLAEYSMLNRNAAPVFSVLKNHWSFSLKYYDYNRVYKKELVSKAVNISNSVTDHELLRQATELQRRLKSYSFIADD